MNTTSPESTIQTSTDGCSMPDHGSEKASSACCHPSSSPDPTPENGTAPDHSFWRSPKTWRNASKNTLTCLIGCSIGDFGMLIFLQLYYPSTPVMLGMALAMTTGLTTSVLLEAAILKAKEGFAWRRAFEVAFSMSFISMLAMETAENATDYLLTGGTVHPREPWFWGALGISLVVGFLAPLPYNYYQLKKHGKACH